MFAYAISLCIKDNLTNHRIIEMTRGAAQDLDIDVDLLDVSVVRPEDYYSCMGHVDIAFRNAFYHLRLGSSFEYAILDTIRRGGDTDTNAAICGALLGAYYGIGGIPVKWLTPVLSCNPDRPLKYKTNSILWQAKKLLTLEEN
jgi:ADP-ribosylglycohydrolase